MPAPQTFSLCGPRVRLRQWADADLAPFAAMNADPEVMRYFAAPSTREESDAGARRQRERIETQGFGLWALEVPRLGFAGFVGIGPKLPFALSLPGIAPESHEIGWRLARAAWGQGYATEAATLALRHAFEVLGLAQIVSITAVANAPSQAVMKRIGLTLRGAFEHPSLPEGHALRQHVLYAQDASSRGTTPP
jgi:RimJ/RimL family protein N-acetyltransferase